jgi:hypothetical protein
MQPFLLVVNLGVQSSELPLLLRPALMPERRLLPSSLRCLDA